MRPYRKKRDLANWIRRRLGAPIIDVTIDSTQIDDCIDQACDYFGEHAGGIGHEESIILISPEQVYYDGTGNASQPAPIAGKWRTTATDPASASPGFQCDTPDPSGTTTCPPPVDTAQPRQQFGGPDGNPATNFSDISKSGTPCPVETCLPGPGWCDDNIQDPHCFTEIGPSDPNAVGPYWVEGDTTSKPGRNGFVFKTVYDVPSDVIAINERLTSGALGSSLTGEDNALFAPAGALMQGGGSWGMQSPGSSVDNRWGFWMGGSGGFVDIVGYQIGMQYIEMFRQMFTIKMTAQLLDLEHKVRLSPPPTDKGVIALSCVRKVHDMYMYEHQWVREYALALCMVNIGMNLSKYGNITMPGGGTINGELYLSRGDTLREKLEEQIADGRYAEPPDFFVG